MRLLVPLLFVMVFVYWVFKLLWFVFVENFENVVASVVICLLSFLPLYLFRWFSSRDK